MLRRDGWAVGSQPSLAALPRGGTGATEQTAAPAQDGGALRGALRAEAAERGLEPGAWSLDFIHDQLSNGTKFRALTVVDIYSREALAVELGQRLRGEHVVEVLNRLVRQRGASRYLFADNGAEFIGQLVDLWAYHHGVRIDFSRPGRPTDNAYIETFNGLDDGMNASTCTGSPRWPRPGLSSRPRGGTTTRAVLTWLSATGRRRSISCTTDLSWRRRV